MKSRVGIFWTAPLLIAIACDPGMTIRQITSPGATKGVAFSIKTGRPLIGETWYAPEVKVSNSSDLPITVTGMELVARLATYSNKPRRSGTYPLIVAPHETKTLDVWFDLNDNVKKTFRQSADLRVHYRIGGEEEVVHLDIVGGPLDSSAP